MSRKITDLESIIDPISVLFRRARLEGNEDVPAPSNMHFSDDNDITLVWNLTNLAPMESVSYFESIKSLAMSEFTNVVHEDIGIITYTSQIVWHGDYPDVYFRVVMPIEVIKCPDLIGSQSVSS